MPLANPSETKLTTSKQSTGSSSATVTQGVARAAEVAIKMSLANGFNDTLTTSDDQDRIIRTRLDQRQGNKDLNLAEIVNFPEPHRHRSLTFHAIQEWEGYVTDINGTGFTANLVDLTAKASYEREEATIPIDEISEQDAEKIQIGSIFRWVIGYQRSETGTKMRVSHIVFRDLPAITKSDLQAGEEWAHKIMADFNL